jgi:hypothetical protein
MRLKNRLFGSAIIYLGCFAAAFVAIGILHVLTDRGINSFFPASYEVRQLSIYLLNVIPIFVVSVFVTIVIITTLKTKNRRDLTEIPFKYFLAAAILSVGLTIVIHQFLFPTSLRAIVFFLLYSSFFACVFPIISWILFGWHTYLQKFRPIPFYTKPYSAIGLGCIVSIGYLIFFKLGMGLGYIVENETYRVQLEPSPQSTWYQNVEKRSSTTVSNKKHYDRSAPNTSVFKKESFSSLLLNADFQPEKQNQFKGPGFRGFGGTSPRIVDIDKNGFFDIALKNSSGAIDIWLNHGGKFRRQILFLTGVENKNIHDFYFADFDNDLKIDLLVSRFIMPRANSFETTFLKKIYWYPSKKPVSRGYLYRQIQLDKWQDVSTSVFPKGLPWAFRKVEPMLWFDANGDGLLDFIWSQYPHPRKPLNYLYVQQKDGTFIDKFSDLIQGGSDRIYAEGSDVADFDGDGDIDLFAFGFLYRNENGKYIQVCGAALPGMFCDASGRNDEGGAFEDIDGDGIFDFILSYHGANSIIPKYFLQLFIGKDKKENGLVRDQAVEKSFYGLNSYLRGVDFDFNGILDVMTSTAGRIVTYHKNQWFDLLPSIVDKTDGKIETWGWIDIDEDGDWDFLARSEKSGLSLYRNQINPGHYVKISMVGDRGVQNQIGATLRVQLPEGRTLVHSYRPNGGYAGVMDPRLIVAISPNKSYFLEACFSSFTDNPATLRLAPGIKLTVKKSNKKNCMNYEFSISNNVSGFDLKLFANNGGAIASIRHTK